MIGYRNDITIRLYWHGSTSTGQLALASTSWSGMEILRHWRGLRRDLKTCDSYKVTR